MPHQDASTLDGFLFQAGCFLGDMVASAKFLFPEELRKPIRAAWQDIQSRNLFEDARHWCSTHAQELVDVGLSPGPQLEMKLAGYNLVMRSWTERASIKLLRPILKWLNTIFGGLQSVPGIDITEASRNVVVYFASDDLALRASKGANLRHRIASRRLGHTGPEDMRKVPDNVYALDCDDVNTAYDTPKGHSYFLDDDDGNPGNVFQHMLACVQSGRVPISGHDGGQSGRLGA